MRMAMANARDLWTRRRFLNSSLLGLALTGAACGGRRSAPAKTQDATVSAPYPIATEGAGLQPGAPSRAGADGGDQPAFADVSVAGPDDVAAYFAGRLPGFPGATIDNYLGYSPADILESMDTVWLDQVGSTYGDVGLQRVYTIVAQNLLDSLLAVYQSRPVVLALDAGHGGRADVFYDPGSNGTEAIHTRKVVGVVEQFVQDSRYASITVRRIFNDAIGDDFGLPPPQDSKTRAQLVLRNGRASMLAYQANAWNRSHAAAPIALHVVSVHFNANSGGTLVLHEGDDVPAEFAGRSVAYAQDYVGHARPALNASGVLAQPLDLVNGNGLHDDSLMFPPPLRAGGARVNPLTGNAFHGPPRYAMLQASLLEQDYVLGLLKYRGLA